MADLDRLRRDLGYFADVIGAPLTRSQAEAFSVHDRSEPETAVVAPRRGGKSRAAAVLGLFWASRGVERHALVVSATEEGAKRLLATAARLARESPVLGSSVAEVTASRIVFSQGSSVRAVSATDAAVRGNTASLVIVDEGALVADDVILGAARPIIASEPEGRFLLVSSALRAGGSFYDAVARGRQGSEFTRTFSWGLQECPWISASEVEAARESLGDLRFRAEYLGEFASGVDALFSREQIAAVTVDLAHLGLDELRGPARFGLGADWGWSSDRTVFTVVGRLAVPGSPLFAVACCRRFPAGFSNDEAIAELVRSPAPLAWAVSEVNGLGAPLTRDLFAALAERDSMLGGGRPQPRTVVWSDDPTDDLPFRRPPRPQVASGAFVTSKVKAPMTARLKGELFSALHLLIVRRQLLIPREAEHLIRELLLLRVEFTETGSQRIEARSGHDDCAMSLALSLRPMQDGRVYLGELARQGERREELPPLPRVPAWVSVTGGGQVTAPIEPSVPDRRLDAAREALRVLTTTRETT